MAEVRDCVVNGESLSIGDGVILLRLLCTARKECNRPLYPTIVFLREYSPYPLFRRIRGQMEWPFPCHCVFVAWLHQYWCHRHLLFDLLKGTLLLFAPSELLRRRRHLRQWSYD